MKESRNEKKKRMETKRNNIIRRLFNREYLRIFPKKENKNTIFLEIQFTWKETHFIRSINIVNKAISRLITHPIDWSINMFSFNRENNYSSSLINDLGKVTSDIDSGIGETNGAGAGT